MAGPRAPVGTLSQHAVAAEGLARGASSSFRDSKHRAKRVPDDDSSSDDSSSDKSSDASAAEDEDEPMDNTDFLNRIKSSSSASQKTMAKPTSTPKPKDSEKKPAVSIKKEPTDVFKPVDPDSSSSSESEVKSESNSSDDSSSEGTSKRIPAVAKAKSEPTKADSSSSDEDSEDNTSESSSSDDDEDSPRETAKSQPTPSKKPSEAKKKAVVKKSALEAPSKSKKAVSESSSSSSDQSSDSEDEQAEPESKALEKRNGNAAVARLPQVVSRDFQLRKAVGDPGATDISKFLKDAHKQGKQIWYFTAPESVPIEVIQKHAIPMDRVQKGQPILTHDGDDYGVGFEATSSSHSIKVVIPGADGARYEMLGRDIDQTIHLKRMTRFDQDGETSIAIVQSQTKSAVVPPRLQPNGLKPRYLPFGVAPSLDSDEDVEMGEASSVAKTKTFTDGKADKKKRKHHADDKEQSSQQKAPDSTKKSKKARFASENGKMTPIPAPALPASNGTGTAHTSTPSSRAAKGPTSSPIRPRQGKETVETTPLPSTQPTKSSGTSSKKETRVPLPQVTGKPAGTPSSAKGRKETPIPPPTIGLNRF